MSDRTVLGIDIGGTSTKMGLVRPTGDIGGLRKMPTAAHGDGPQPYLNRLDALIDDVLADDGADVDGIGVSMHGELNTDGNGTVLGLNTPALIGFDMRGHLSERYGLPVHISNDAMAHALGEYYFGSGRGVERFMCMAVGTGLIASVMIDGKPLLIDGGNSGNTGMIILDPDAPVGATGIPGAAEDLCGVAGIERLARERYGRAVPAHDVIAAARAGHDPVATAIMTQIGAWLGQTLASLSMIFYPHRIALTGGTTTAGDVLLNACGARYDALVGNFFRHVATLPGSHYRPAEIVLGEGGAESGILGATAGLLGLYDPAP